LLNDEPDLLTFSNADWVDLRVGDRGHSDRVQDALPGVEVGVLHADAAGVQGFGAHQLVRPSPPGASLGSGLRGDLHEPPLPALVRLRRPPQVAGALRLHQHHRLPLHLHPAHRLLHHPRRLPPHRQVHHPHGQYDRRHGYGIQQYLMVDRSVD
jgi:hypothetical protein